MKTIVIIGAGPAGLGTAIELNRKKDASFLIIDKNPTVGGLSRSFNFKSHFFDVGPHRFYTKNNHILKIWKSILGKKLLNVKRSTRILYDGKFFTYPVQLSDILQKLSFKDKFAIVTSYLLAKFAIFNTAPKTFEEWCIKNFGDRLYRMFFKTYTEKVWGVKCSQLHVKWARDRIKNLSLTTMIMNMILHKKKSDIKSLTTEFYYPKKGAGYFYEQLVKKYGLSKSLRLTSHVTNVIHANNKIVSIEYQMKQEKKILIEVEQLFSSMPLTHFILSLTPKPPPHIIRAAKKLSYRDHITVNLIVKNTHPFPDNWIYVHSPALKMARITNYSNFIPIANEKKTIALSLEYFAFQEDCIWKKNDVDLMKFARRELSQTGLVRDDNIIDGFIVRETESYPTYYLDFETDHRILRDYVENFLNVELIGRGGMYRYNNMDHAMYTGILSAKNYKLGYKKYDVWNVTEDGEYYHSQSKPS